MILEVFPSGPLETNGILVACPQTKEAVLFDAPPGITYNISQALKNKQLTLKNIFLTHSHWDHMGSVKELLAQYPCKVFIHPLDVSNLKKPGADGLPLLFPIEGVESQELLEDGAWYSIGNLKFQAIHTPGHSPGGTCFYFPVQGVLISGDTLFKGSFGNISFPTSDAEKMWESLKKISTLPSETRVFPGHGEPTILKDERWIANARDFFGF